jgi:hypothetical protein
MTRTTAFAFAAWLFIAAFALAAALGGTVSANFVPANAPSITVNNFTPHAGDTITVTVNPGNLTPSDSDSIRLTWPNSCGEGLVAAPTVNVKGPGSVQIQIPYMGSEVPQQYILVYKLRDPSGNHCDGEPTTFAAQSAVITVPPTVPVPVITAAPPADVTAPPPGWPAQNGRTMTVCASGCQYTNFRDALWDAAYNNPVDYTKIEIAAGNYSDNCRWGSADGPAHLWIHGHGGGFPKIVGTCGLELNNGSRGQITIDNLEMDHLGIGTGGYCPNILLRNIYMHDVAMGFFVGLMCNGINVTVLNSRISRAGGPTGPSHAAYINDANQNTTLTVKRSVFEATQVGHTFKTRAVHNLFDCDIIMQGYDPVYNGSEIIDMDSASGQTTIQNSLLGKGPYWRNHYQNNYISLEYAVDVETPDPGPPNYLVLNNNIFLQDLGTIVNSFVNPAGQQGIFIAANRPLRSGGTAPPLPYVWSNNKFIGRRGYQQFTSGGPYIDPGYYFPFGIPGNGGNASDVDLGTPGGACPAPLTSSQCVAYDSNAPNSHGNLFYSSRAAAGIGAISPGPGVYYLWPYDSRKFPMPSACTDPVGNVAVPRLDRQRR